MGDACADSAKRQRPPVPAIAGASSHDIDIDGVRLHWASVGSAHHAAPVVLLHGIADSHLTWRATAGYLSADHLLLMPDLPGCGLSSRPNATYSLNWHAQIICRWVRQVTEGPVDVVGHSFGGGVAQMMLLLCPEKIRRLVLVAAGGLGREVGFWLRLAAVPFFVEYLGQPFMRFGTRQALERLREAGLRQEVEALSAMNAEQGTARAFSRSVRDVINYRGQTRQFLDQARRLHALPPIALFWGECDRVIPMQHGRDFLSVVRGAHFRAFSGCGHYVHQENPEAFAAGLRSFLDSPAWGPSTLCLDAEKK